jgi:hypothetical protein
MSWQRGGWAVWVCAAILPASVACTWFGDAGTTTSDPVAPAGETVTATPPLAALSGGATSLDADAIAAGVAASLGLSPAEIDLVLVQAATWPDGCLGLAEAGQVCSQALVEGWLAVVQLPDGTELRFRGGNGRVMAERP